MKASYRSATEEVVPLVGQNLPTTDAVNSTIMQWGPIQFKVWPLNFHEMEHHTETDWAKKPIAGAAIYREWVGENDEKIHLRGQLFPYRLGGMNELQLMEDQRRQGVSNLLINGGGDYLGWFVCESIDRAHTYISAEGVGQVIVFDAVFARVPVPYGPDYFATLWQAGVVGA